jgi:hypothetical protein
MIVLSTPELIAVKVYLRDLRPGLCFRRLVSLFNKMKSSALLTSSGFLLFHRFFWEDSLVKLSNHWKIMRGLSINRNFGSGHRVLGFSGDVLSSFLQKPENPSMKLRMRGG